MAITDKTLMAKLEEKIGPTHMVKVDLEAWVIPGCEGALADAINKALGDCVVVSDWGISVLHGDGKSMIIP